MMCTLFFIYECLILGLRLSVLDFTIFTILRFEAENVLKLHVINLSWAKRLKAEMFSKVYHAIRKQHC